MKITNSTRAIILEGISKKGINQTKLAEHLGLNKNWSTRLFNGETKTLDDDYVDKIADYLDISFLEVTPKGESVSAMAVQLTDGMNKSERLPKLLIELMGLIDELETNNKAHLPHVKTKLLGKIGGEVEKIVYKYQRPDGDYRPKIGLEVIELIRDFYTKEEKAASNKSTKKETSKKTPQEIIRNYPHPAVITDLERKTLAISPSMTLMCGHPESEFIGKKPAEVLQGKLTTEDQKKKAKEVMLAESGEFDITNHHADGSDYDATILIRRAGNFFIAREVSKKRGFNGGLPNARKEADELAKAIKKASK